MALQQVLNTSSATPYSRPPYLTVKTVATRPLTKVLSWDFSLDGTASAILSKQNILVAVTDGVTATKLTLYEDMSTRLSAGETYILRGYELMGKSPPFIISIRKETMVFKTAPLKVSDAITEMAEALINPPSPEARLSEEPTGGVVTVAGHVVEMSAIRKISSGKDAFPLRNLYIEQDSSRVSVALWREAAVFPIHMGQHIRFTHMKGSKTAYGYRLQSTMFTEHEEVTDVDTWELVDVLGTMETEGGKLNILLTDNRVLNTTLSLWGKVGELTTVPYPARVKLRGVEIVEISGNEI